VNRGVLRSTLGAGGGYVLARPPSEISLLQIVDALDNPLEPKIPKIPGIADALRERVQLSVSKSVAAGRIHLATVTLAELARATPAESLMSNSEGIVLLKDNPPVAKHRSLQKKIACG
jgi:DNA-binding IscR family transcriptional regulator